jgi:predicted transcriptional regulator
VGQLTLACQARSAPTPESAAVTVVLDEDTANDNVEATPEQLAELDEAIAEADRGEGIPWETVRAELFGNR